MKKMPSFAARLLGFEKLSGYERGSLHQSNLQTSVYVGFITIALEIWMLARQTVTRIIPKYQEGGDLFTLVVQNTSKYVLFLLFGLGLMLFCRTCLKGKKATKRRFGVLGAFGLVCVLYTPVVFLETFTQPGGDVTPLMAGITNALTVSLYVLLFLFGAGIILFAALRYRDSGSAVFLEHTAVILYSLVCVAFGFLVSYTDFWSGKEITCFLMMMIYVGILLMYRPYITILTLGGCFLAFYYLLLTFQGGASFHTKEVVIFGQVHNVSSGDTVNYITFFVSLAAICVAMYHARLREARKTGDLRAASAELEKRHNEMHEQFIQTSKALAGAIDAKDPYTNGHSVRVAEYARSIAEAAGKTAEECEEIYYAGLLHDVGKIGVSKAILSKPGRLTGDEFGQIKKHTVMGSQILSNISLMPWLSAGAHFHHERYDGGGYPEGLSGTDIPESARIIAVADAYDAMTSNRSYRTALPQHLVREELVKGSGTQFDPEYARTMIQMIDHDVDYRMHEAAEGETAPATSLRCGNVYDVCTEGWIVEEKLLRIRLSSRPDEQYPPEESLPVLIAFDSLDGMVHPGEENNRDLLYCEYARIRLDGQVTPGNVRNAETRLSSRPSDLENVTPETSRLYRIEAVRRGDHALVRIMDAERVQDVILALPDRGRFMYLAVSGEHCEIHNISAKTEEVSFAGEIPRIAEEISFIRGRPEGDLRNIEVDGWRADTTEGVPLSDGMRVTFHTRSLPAARMVWHCAFVSLFTSENGKVNGPGYREYMLFRLNGEDWESDAHVRNTIRTKLTEDFTSWNDWKERNRRGIDCAVDISRNGDRVVLSTENLGVSVRGTSEILDGAKDLYIALTGDQCAVTDIHIRRKE